MFKTKLRIVFNPYLGPSGYYEVQYKKPFSCWREVPRTSCESRSDAFTSYRRVAVGELMLDGYELIVEGELHDKH